MESVAVLITNSIDALQEQRNKNTALKTIEKDGWLEVSVSDTGPGISSDIASRIMDPFFTTKEVGEGKGLGLSVAKGNIESHSGNINLLKFDGICAFVIRIPVAPEEHSPLLFDRVAS